MSQGARQLEVAADGAPAWPGARRTRSRPQAGASSNQPAVTEQDQTPVLPNKTARRSREDSDRTQMSLDRSSRAHSDVSRWPEVYQGGLAVPAKRGDTGAMGRHLYCDPIHRLVAVVRLNTRRSRKSCLVLSGGATRLLAHGAHKAGKRHRLGPRSHEFVAIISGARRAVFPPALLSSRSSFLRRLSACPRSFSSRPAPQASDQFSSSSAILCVSALRPSPALLRPQSVVSP